MINLLIALNVNVINSCWHDAVSVYDWDYGSVVRVNLQSFICRRLNTEVPRFRFTVTIALFSSSLSHPSMTNVLSVYAFLKLSSCLILCLISLGAICVVPLNLIWNGAAGVMGWNMNVVPWDERSMWNVSVVSSAVLSACNVKVDIADTRRHRGAQTRMNGLGGR
jgi:hypothetical protein